MTLLVGLNLVELILELFDFHVSSSNQAIFVGSDFQDFIFCLLFDVCKLFCMTLDNFLQLYLKFLQLVSLHMVSLRILEFVEVCLQILIVLFELIQFLCLFFKLSLQFLLTLLCAIRWSFFQFTFQLGNPGLQLGVFALNHHLSLFELISLDLELPDLNLALLFDLTQPVPTLDILSLALLDQISQFIVTFMLQVLFQLIFPFPP